MAPIGEPLAPAYVSEPSQRGTIGLLTSCISTLLLCIWSAIHMNVFPGNPRSSRRCFSKIMWAIVALVVPEVLLIRAIWQLETARNLRNKRNAFLSDRDGPSSTSNGSITETSVVSTAQTTKARRTRWGSTMDFSQ